MAAILVIDDDPLVRQFADLILSQAGHDVILAADGSQALDVLGHNRIGLLLLDFMLPGMTGLGVLTAARKLTEAPIMMITSRADIGTVKACIAAGAQGYVIKPFHPGELIRHVDARLRPATAIASAPRRSSPMPAKASETASVHFL